MKTGDTMLIRGIHTMLHNALDRAVKERLIVRNPADDCVPSKIPKHEMKILPPEQIKSYLTAADQRGVLPMFPTSLVRKQKTRSEKSPSRRMPSIC